MINLTKLAHTLVAGVQPIGNVYKFNSIKNQVRDIVNTHRVSDAFNQKVWVQFPNAAVVGINERGPWFDEG